MRTEMQDYFDDRSEAWQEGEKGEAFQEALDLLDVACGAVDEFSLE